MKKLITLSMLVLFTGLWFNVKADYVVESTAATSFFTDVANGQSFTTIAAGDLTDLTVYSYGTTNSTLRIFSGESVDPADEIHNQVVSFSGQTTVNIVLTNTVALSAASVYTWYIDLTTLVGANFDNYGGGMMAYQGGFYSGYDLYFQAFITTAGPNPGEWTGAASSNEWNTAGNWDDNNVPTAAVNVTVPGGLAYYPVIDEAGDVCLGMSIAAGGSVTVATGGNLAIGADLNANGSFIMNDGTCTIVGDLNNNDGANALVDINDGILNIGGGWYQNGFFSFAQGSFQLSGGTITVGADVAWYDTGGTSLMDGPFYMTIGGTFQTESFLFADISDGTIELTGTNGGGGYFLSPSSASGATVYNLTVSGGDYIWSRPAEYNPIDILNDLNITGGFVTTSIGTGRSSTITVGGDCTVGVGASVSADVLTGWTVGGAMSLEADATGYASWIDNGLLSVAAKSPQTVQVAMAGPQWHMISSPVPAAVSGLYTGMYLQNFSEGTNVWSDIIPTNVTLTPAQGFALYSLGAMVTNYTGSYNTGSYNANLTRTNAGWNAVGNPYPSPIDWDAAPISNGWTKTNVANATYVEDAGNWATWIAGVGTGNGNNIIAPGQGFFVECTNAAGGSLGFTDSIRTHTSTAFLKSEVANLVRLNVSDNEYNDDMVIRFLDEASEGFDYDYDARKLFAYNEEIPQIYSMANGYMAINSLPATSMVPTGFRTNIAGEFTIVATETSEFNNVVLEDLFTGIQTDLLTESYTFPSTSYIVT